MKYTRRIIAVLLAVMMILSVLPNALASSFEDVKDTKWYAEAVEYCFENGIMSGVGDGSKFDPNGIVPREQAVQALYALDGAEVAAEQMFPDVKTTKWYAPAVTWGAKNEIVAGLGDGTFGVGVNVTREQMASFFFRYANFVGADTSAADDLAAFPDKNDTSKWAKESVQWAVAAKILSGKGQKDGTTLLKPKDPLTRAELAQMMMQFHKLINAEEDLTGKTVILHSNDVHGAIDGYKYITALKADFEAKGAEVILADAGDYSQGSTYVSLSKGANAVTMMNEAGYDVATLGNHEFDYGYAQLAENLEKANFKVVCADILKDGEAIYDPYTIIEKGGVKVAFVGLDTPEAQTKVNPALIKGLDFLADTAIWEEAQKQVDAAKAEGADLIVGLVHLGVDDSSKPYTSYDLTENVTGLDFIIDGHSHTVMEEGANGEPIQSTGTAFANIGVIVIDNETKAIEDNYLYAIGEDAAADEAVAAVAKELMDAVDAEYGEVFAKSEVELNGDKAPNGNRDSETNNGDMITDAMIWCVTEQYPGSITEVPAENIVAITNGGGIRAWIHEGDVTKNDVLSVLPFGNTVAVVYVTGAELLEALEASTYCTPDAVGGFPQIAGMQIIIDTTKEYDANEETYPGSTYYGPATINRVEIVSVNGQPFDPEAKYAVVTNNFCAAGGDTYYAFAAATSQFDTGYTLDAVVMDYITEKLGGVIDAQYAAPQSRINILTDMTGKTVILHSNDVHGSVAGYAYIAEQKALFEAEGAEVILADAGDYSQGTTAVSLSKGANAIDLMNAVGYDVATLGNHEFDYGYPQLAENLEKAEFAITCSDILKDGEALYDPYTIIEKGGMKIAFVGLETPEAQTKANPALIQGLTFLTKDTDPELWANTKAQADAAKAAGADIVVALAHLGVDEGSHPYTSYDLAKNVEGLDFIIDGHSHTVMEAGKDGEKIQSTGTAFANIGCIVIDNETKTIEDNYLIPVKADALKDEAVAAKAQEILDAIDAEYGEKFATSEVDLNGDKEPGNRTEETNNGDLITDAMIWCVTEQYPGSIAEVPAENIVAITNGGGIRAWIHKGDVTKNDILTVLPFGNTVAVVYVTGAELLEALEASTFCTPISVGGFPQVAGINFTIDADKAYDPNDATYPGSTYYGPKTINRVTIDSINGKDFDPEAKYAIVTNNFCAGGGDTYYAFAAATSQFDTGYTLDTVVMDYISEKLGGVISAEQYAEPQGRITVKYTPPEDDKITIGGLDADIWMTKYGNVYTDCKATKFTDDLGFEWGDIVTVKFLDKELDLPVVPTYAYVDTGVAAIIMNKSESGDPTGYISLAINMGDFATTYGIATKTTNEDKTWFWTAQEGVEFPIEVTFTMKEEGGYMAEYILHDLNRTNAREDYAALTDAEFANFRQVTTTGMGNVLYRGSSPVNPEIGRNTYADAAIEAAGVTVILNLADDKASAEAYAGFSDSYYSKQNVKYLCLGVDFAAADFKAGLAEGMKFLSENEGTYYIHCTEGKDRAGFVNALLECLMGATYDEVVADYMVTYYNYYGVEPSTEKYTAIANSNIIKTLATAFGVSDLSTADLAAEAEEYFKTDLGLSDGVISALKANLAK